MALNLQSSLIQLVANFTLNKAQGGKFPSQTLGDYLGGQPNGLNYSLGVGSAGLQVNHVFIASPSIVSGSPQLYRLVTAGALIDADGVTVANFTDFVFAAFLNNGTANVTIGGGTNALLGFFGAATGTIVLPPGTPVILGPLQGASPSAWPLAGGAGTSDTLQLVAASGTQQVDLILAGH